MYSPADRPSSTRAAPAKNRIWSSAGPSSSESVRPRGLPVLATSAATSSSPRDSNASAILFSAFCRSAGVASRQPSNAASAARTALSTSAAEDTGADAKTWPVVGSTRSLVRPSAVSTKSPPTKLRSGRDGAAVAALESVTGRE